MKSDESKIRSVEIARTKIIAKKLDCIVIPENTNELRLFAVARNEGLRLPYFLSYYFNMGIDRIFLIDNDSSDDTCEIALANPRVHLFQIKEDFKNFWNWIEYFLDTYGKDTWCLVVDIDELFSYPLSEHVKFKDFVNYLNSNSFTGVKSKLLDLYSDKPIADSHYIQGEDPLKTCRFFDKDLEARTVSLFDPKHHIYFAYELSYGGPRQRIFGDAGDYTWAFCLSKIGLFKYSDQVYLTEGMHALNGVSFADVEGVTFHTKFMSDFVCRSRMEADREQHYCDAVEYKFYDHFISAKPKLSMYNENSVMYINSMQLVNNGIVEASASFLEYAEQLSDQL